MNMEIGPIFSSLRRHRIPALLIIVEIALACAVLCNAVFMISQRVVNLNLSNAIDEAGLSVINVDGTDPKLAPTSIPRNLEALRAIPGVEAATITNTLPLTNNGWNAGLSARPDAKHGEEVNTAAYLIGEGTEQTLGLRLLRGRFFTPEEYAGSKLGSSFWPETHVAIITDDLGKKLWPGQEALGKVIYEDQFNYTVVGVVADVLRPDDNGEGNAALYFSAFFPLAPGDALSYYVIRSRPAERQRIIQESITVLGELEPAAVIKGSTFSDIRNKYFANVSSMIWMLVLVCVVMLAVTAFGIVGLSSFWVQQRRRQIGIRRAVGATRGDILRYFQIENFLLTASGVVLGLGAAFGINAYLMAHYEMNRMPWYYLPLGAVALWLIGQLSVLGPALRAASVPPVVATRSA